MLAFFYRPGMRESNLSSSLVNILIPVGIFFWGGGLRSLFFPLNSITRYNLILFSFSCKSHYSQQAFLSQLDTLHALFYIFQHSCRLTFFLRTHLLYCTALILLQIYCIFFFFYYSISTCRFYFCFRFFTLS